MLHGAKQINRSQRCIGLRQTYMMDCFEKIVKLLTSIAKTSIKDLWLGPKYTSGNYYFPQAP